MLVSHSHKFIFIKSKKTAGSSIQDFLAPYCKKGIVEKYIPGSHRSAKSTKQLVGEELWNSYLKICPVRNPWDKMVSWYFWRKRKRSFFVRLKRILMGRDPQNEAYRMSFKDYLLWLDSRGEANIDHGIVFIGNQWEDYFFIRYEHMMEDLKSLCEKLTIPFDEHKLPKQKTGFRESSEYRKYYDEDSRKIVDRAYAREIAKFGYKF